MSVAPGGSAGLEQPADASGLLGALVPRGADPGAPLAPDPPVRGRSVVPEDPGPEAEVPLVVEHADTPSTSAAAMDPSPAALNLLDDRTGILLPLITTLRS